MLAVPVHFLVVRLGCQGKRAAGSRPGSLLASQCDRAGRADSPLRARGYAKYEAAAAAVMAGDAAALLADCNLGLSRASQTLASLAPCGMGARVTASSPGGGEVSR